MSATLRYTMLKTELSRKSKLSASSQGLTLLEMALGMMILSVLSVGVSSIVKAGIESQMSEQAHQYMQTIGMNIVDDLRHDIRVADQVTVTNGGNTLQVILDSTTNQTAFYELVGTEFRRREAGKQTKIYNDPSMYTSLMQVTCPSGCFEANQTNSNSVPRQIRIPEIVVQKSLPSGNAGSIIDRHFRRPNFSIRDFAFDVATATEFR